MPESPSIRKSVTVSVVSHGQATMVNKLLSDLNQHCSDAIEKLVLTCNTPEKLAFGAHDFGFAVQILNNSRPLGFGANHNRAFAHCDTEWFLVLNPDLRLNADVLSTLLLRAHPTTGLLAPQEMNEAGQKVDNLRGPITPWELLQRNLLRRPPLPPPYGGWVKGMFMLTRSEAYRAIQGFDERYFMYCEDFDLCARLMLRAWRVDHHVDVTVTHAWQRGSHFSISKFAVHVGSLARMWASAPYWQYRKNMRLRH